MPSPTSPSPPYTDYLASLDPGGFSFGDAELPSGALGCCSSLLLPPLLTRQTNHMSPLRPSIQEDDTPGVEAVVAETDNYLIDQSEAQCDQVTHSGTMVGMEMRVATSSTPYH